MEREERTSRKNDKSNTQSLPGYKGESFTVKLDKDAWANNDIWEEIWREDPQMIIELLKYIGIR